MHPRLIGVTHLQGFEKALQVKDKIVIADFYAEYVSLCAQESPHDFDDVPHPVGAVPARFWGQSLKRSPRTAP